MPANNWEYLKQIGAGLSKENARTALHELKTMQIDLLRSEIKDVREVGINLLPIIEKIEKGLNV